VTLPGTAVTLEKGWQALWTASEQCLYTVPATWTPSPGRGWAVNPDGRMSVHVGELVSAGWTAHKLSIMQAVQPTTVLDDGERRLWIERADPRRILHHVSVNDGRVVCSADLEIRRSAEPTSDLVNRIVAGIHVAHAADLRSVRP
jgi:hypothetical protein